MYEPGVVGATKETEDLAAVEQGLTKYRFYLLQLDRLLEWEPSWTPGVAVAVVTVVFALTWYLEPTLLTTLSLLGFLACVLEYSAPFLSNHFYKQPEQWNVILEQRYSKVCDRMLHSRKHLACFVGRLCALKADKPNSFLMGAAGFCLLTAWIGFCIDTLLLVYLLVVALVLVPGLRHHGIIQKVVDLVKSKLQKPKAN